MSTRVRLSQCMIVKNEEDNIERALTWGRGAVWEQIVVDTGSTDRTVELAEKMGAVVYHFPWNDDFSAAKNYAIDKASGNWIAFLDADEYLLESDVQKLMTLLEKLERDYPSNKRPHVVTSALANINEQGIAFAMATQTRVFQNIKQIRYAGAIHEQVQHESGKPMRGYNAINYITIQHTGYSATAYKKTKKLERNIRLLRKELEENPGDGKVMIYLAESLSGVQQTDEAAVLLESLIETASAEKPIFRQDTAFYFLLKIYIDRNSFIDTPKIEHLLQLFAKTGSDFPDIDYLAGIWKIRNKSWEEAISFLEEALAKQGRYKGTSTVYMSSKPEEAFYLLATAYQELHNNGKAVQYCTLALRAKPYSERVLAPLLSMLHEDVNTPFSDVIVFLEKLYDLSKMKDKLFLYKCAKKLSYFQLEDYIYDTFTEEEKDWFNGREELWLESSNDMWMDRYPDIYVSNKIDRDFLTLLDEIWEEEADQITNKINRALNDFKQKRYDDYKTILDFFSQFPFWGKLIPGDDCTAIEGRALVLANHKRDIIWLYSRLMDYRSKRTLLAILQNWLYLDIQALESVKADYKEYFDLDLIPSGKDEVVADLGAYTGDTLKSFVQTYGETYKHYYCYEASPQTLEALTRTARRYRDVTVTAKGVWSENRTMYLREGSSSAFHMLTTDETQIDVLAVALDHEISTPLTFIKMDIEGGEKEALMGCRKQVKENHPKLALAAYHGYDQLWQLARMIDEIEPSYHFYLRYYGGNLVPSEFVLFAL